MVHAASAERRGTVHGIVGSQCQFGIRGGQDEAELQRAQGRVYLRATEGDGAVSETAAGMMLS